MRAVDASSDSTNLEPSTCKPSPNTPAWSPPMDRANVDTDQIIPKQFLKRIERTGFGQFLFFDWRFHDDGTPNPTSS